MELFLGRPTLAWTLGTFLLLQVGCGGPPRPDKPASVSRSPFGVLPSGDSVEQYTLTNRHGMSVQVITYGGIITAIRVPDRDRTLGDIVLGFDSLEGYLHDSPYFGAIVGRYANRIARGRFTLDGSTYRLAVNNGVNHLHGGLRGFDKVLWTAESFQSDSGVGVVLRYTSPDGEEGYPGTLKVQVTYRLTDDDRFVIDYLATTDKATPVNLSQHSYFNLNGVGSGDILGHDLRINADSFTPVDSTLIPTGIAPVEGTPFDFRQPTAIGLRIGQPDPQLLNGKGYDHNFVLSRHGAGLDTAARVFAPESGRELVITTTEPGLQFYSGNFLDGTLQGKGAVFGHRTGFCLETQHYPDSPNHPGFPSTILRPGEEHRSQTVWAFTTATGERR